MEQRHNAACGPPTCSILKTCVYLVVAGIFVVVVIILVIYLKGSSKGKSDSEQQSDTTDGVMRPSCGDGWMSSRDKCYYFSDAEGNWTTANDFCTSMNSFLAVLEDQRELNFAMQHKGSYDGWIGLKKDQENKWKWVDGSEYNLGVEVNGGSKCAYLNHQEVSSAQCRSTRHWICTRGINMREGKRNS